jgi:hypothetical protein
VVASTKFFIHLTGKRGDFLITIDKDLGAAGAGNGDLILLKNKMKKTYSSPRLTEYGTTKEIDRMFGLPSEKEEQKELIPPPAFFLQAASPASADSPRAV